MGKHLLAKAHIANSNELTESEVTELTSSTVGEPALAILKRQGIQGITIVCSQRKIIFDIHISKMYFSHWKTPGVSERMWSVILDASISGEYQTLGGHSCRPSE